MDTINSKFLNLNLNDIAGAVISSIVVALVAYLGTVTNIMDIDFKQVLNIAFLTGVASLLKALSTGQDGKFLGAIKVK